MVFGTPAVWNPPTLVPRGPGPGGPPVPQTWWDQYSNQLTHSPQVIGEISSSSANILAHLNPTLHQPDGRLSVVGAIQSGKTASMIGVVAKAMDDGFQIIVVLSGSKNTLRNQTALRFNKELLGLSEGTQDNARAPMIWTDVLPPPGQAGGIIGPVRYNWYRLPGKKHSCGFLPWHKDATGIVTHLHNLCHRLATGEDKHIILTVKKQSHNLQRLMEALDVNFVGNKADYSMLIIDDESDEVTCPPLNAINTGRLRPLAHLALHLSRGIPSPADPNDRFRTHAVEYTATPQAPHCHPPTLNCHGFVGQPNPFHSTKVVVLRTPADQSANTMLNYSSAPNYDGWYTGGSFFYDHDPPVPPQTTPRGMNAKHPRPPTNPCNPPPPIPPLYNPTPPPLELPMPNDSLLSNPYLIRPPCFPYDRNVGDMEQQTGLKNAVLGYLVSGAIRLAQQSGKTLGGLTDWPKPHAMLLHTERTKAGHWNLSYEIAGLIEGLTTPHATVVRENSPLGPLNRANIRTWLTSCSAEIDEWFEYYEMRYDMIVTDGASRPPFPSRASFQTALDDVSRHVKIKVINSDRDASKLRWEETRDANGAPIKPDDIYTIVIGGDVLARGLTIPGLATTWFTRDSSRPLEDTVIQRQRWLGYRGSMWEFVTLHAPMYLLEELKAMHIADEQARIHMYGYSISGESPAANVLRVTQRRMRGSGKIGASFEPIPTPHTFFKKVQFECNGATEAQNNESLAGDIIREINLNPAPTLNGGSGMVNVTNQKTAEEIADYLDRLEFSDHGPVANPFLRSNRAYHFFAAAESHFSPGVKILKPATKGCPQASIQSWTQDPYLVAAYLRFWHHITHNAGELQKLVTAGLITGSGSLPTPVPPPMFNLVFSGGGLATVSSSTDPSVSSPNPGLCSTPVSEAGVKVEGQEAISTWMGHVLGTSPGGSRYLDINPALVDPAGGRDWTDPRPPVWDGMLMVQIMETNGTHTSRIQNLPAGVTHANVAPNYAPIEFAISIPQGGPVLSFIGA